MKLNNKFLKVCALHTAKEEGYISRSRCRFLSIVYFPEKELDIQNVLLYESQHALCCTSLHIFWRYRRCIRVR